MGKFETLCNEYRENKRLIEELTALNEELKTDILTIMGNNETMIQGATKAINKVISSTRLDSSALKKDLPNVFQQYSKETSYRRFIVI